MPVSRKPRSRARSAASSAVPSATGTGRRTGRSSAAAPVPDRPTSRGPSTPERIVLTNGGAEAIALVAAAHPKGWVDDPDFSLYARHLTSIEAGAPRWRSNPHNPTGRLAPRDERADVWDESFYALATGCWTRGDAGATVVASLTKLSACPGL